MSDDWETFRQRLICEATGAREIVHRELIQKLWSGYGELLRYRLEGAQTESIILKDVDLTGGGGHPRGWNTDAGHRRKLRSYEVEAAWYRDLAARCTTACRVPRCLGVTRSDNRVCIVLEDLDAAGFPLRLRHAGLREAKLGLHWLAAFHATFLDTRPVGLWPVGTYWNLATREEEWCRMPEGRLKKAASRIDDRLSQTRYQTIVHGDAKLANFCFSRDRTAAAAVDFQYVGGGCGMKDVAYFIGSVFEEEECGQFEKELLESYFTALRKHLPPSVNAAALEQEWRDLYPVAWTDFHRFLLGWSPGHQKLHGYSERMSQQTLDQIAQPST